MKLIKKLALVLWLVLLPHAYSNAQTAADLDPAQVYNTGNIVVPTTTTSGSTWVNGVYQDALTCWSWGDPGYCGPNAIVRPGGNINFSFGQTNLYQMRDIASVLPDSGTGLRVNGYNFSFTAKNGNGWDDGRVDYLNAYVSLYNKDGSVAYNQNYNLTYNYNWTTFNISETFASPYAAKDLGSVQYGFVGQDWNGWAGPYGPEIYGVSFSLKYSVDPCVQDPLYASTCPGYLEALQALIPDIAPTAESPTLASTTTAAETIAAEPLLQSQVAVSSGSQSSATEPQQTATASSTPQQTATASPTETQTSQQKKPGPSLSQIQSIVGAELSRINQVETKTVSDAVAQAEAAAQSAVDQAEAVAGSLTDQSIQGSVEQAQTSMTQTQQQSQQSSSASQTVSQGTRGPAAGSTMILQTTQSTESQVDNMPQPQQNQNNQLLQPTAEPQSQQSIQSSTVVVQSQTTVVADIPQPELPRSPQAQTTQTQNESQSSTVENNQPASQNNPQQLQPAIVIVQPDTNTDTAILPLPPQSQTPTSTDTIPVPETTTVVNTVPQVEPVEPQTIPQAETKVEEILNPLYSLLPPRSSVAAVVEAEPEPARSEPAVLSNTPRAEQAADRPQIVDTRPQAAQGPAVNRSVANNDAAGGVDLTALAVQPQGFAAYSTALTDAAFYAPKEIYRNQKTVDNQRAVRFLNAASDKLHQQMVDQQYQGAK